MTTTIDIEVLQQFVDDTFLFRESSIMDVEAWKSILQNYEDRSGQ